MESKEVTKEDPWYGAVLLNTKTISDAWFQLIYNILPEEGLSYNQKIQRGSFENDQYRYQYPGVAIYIEQPWKDMYPIIPEGLGIPSPSNKETVDTYFANYLMDPILSENEVYRYSSRIHEKIGEQGISQLDAVIKMLKETPLTNQAIIEIGSAQDYTRCIGKDNKVDPPCLRLIDFKVIPTLVTKTNQHLFDRETNIGDVINKLTVSVYFRSWDLWAGFPVNLGGIELLKQYVSLECGIENGSMFAYSSGLHIYQYQEQIARIRMNKKG